jgi:hypothetical protein
VQATNLGETLRRKYIEKQVEKAEGVHRYLCSGVSGLNMTFLEDLLRPLNEGGKVFQLKMLNYINFVLTKARNPDEVDSVIDTYPDYWNREELPKEEKLRDICRRIYAAVDELWEETDDVEVRELIIRIRYGGYSDKRELLEQIRMKLDTEMLAEAAREKIASMLRCFLLPEEDDTLKLLAANMLIFKLGDDRDRASALDYLKFYVENKNLNYAEKGSIATTMESLLNQKRLSDELRHSSRYILFITNPERFDTTEEQNAILSHLRSMVEGNGLSSRIASQRVLESLALFSEKAVASEELKQAAMYLESRIRNPGKLPAGDNISKED